MCLQPYPQTVLAACQMKQNPLTGFVSSPLQQNKSSEARLTWPQVFLSQNCTTKALFHPFHYLFHSSSQNPGSFFKNYPQTEFHIFSKSKILEDGRKVYRNKFKYVKFMVKRDYKQ